VPTRDLLLDAGEVAAWLERFGGAHGPLAIEECVRDRAKYRVGDGLRAVYRLRVDGRELWLSARSMRPERALRILRASLADAASAEPLRAIAHAPELEALFLAFPNDRKISGLRLLAGGLALERLVGRPHLRSELVAWAPEATATARCLDARGRVVAYAKVYAEDVSPRTCATHATLRRFMANAGPGAPRVPRVLAHSPARRAVVLEPVSGPTLLELADTERARSIERLGTALAVLHGAPIPELSPAFDRFELDRLQTAGEVIGLARPDVATPARALAAELRAGAARASADELVCLHGDPHPGNAVAANDAIALIDLDHVAAGPAAADLARVLAGLTLERLQGRLGHASETELTGRLLDGYRARRALPGHATLAWHTAASLLTRTSQPAVTRVRPAVLDRLPEILTIARELLR